MASGTATGTYNVTVPSTSVNGVATGTYDVTTTGPSSFSGTATGTYDVTVSSGVTATGTATGTYDVTALVSGGLFRVVNGKIVRPYLYRIVNGKIVSQADDATAPPPVSIPETILGYVGDSLTVGGLTNGLMPLVNTLGFSGTGLANNGTRATAGGTNIHMDGLVGRSIVNGVAPYIPSSQDVINTWRAAGFHPNEWVIGLITNDFGESLNTLKSNMNALLNLIVAEPSTKILWVGPVLQPGAALQTQIPTMKQALNEVAAARTDVTMVVLDLEAAIHNGRDESTLWLGGDGRHMTAAGYTLRNQIIVQAMVDNGMSHQAAVVLNGAVPATVTANV